MFHSYRTEDGVTMIEGDRAYDYYNMKPGKIGRPVGAGMRGLDGWFEFIHDDGTVESLNGQRICTLGYAKHMGFKGAES